MSDLSAYDECPGMSCTTFMSTPAAGARVAAPWPKVVQPDRRQLATADQAIEVIGQPIRLGPSPVRLSEDFAAMGGLRSSHCLTKCSISWASCRSEHADTDLSVIGHEFDAVVERSEHGRRMTPAAFGRDRVGLTSTECHRSSSEARWMRFAT